MKIAITYGLVIAVIIAIVNSIFVDLFGIEYEFVRKYSGFFPFLILGTGLFQAMKKWKETVYAGDMNYGQAIYSGIVSAAFVALFCAIINFFYFQLINTNYAEEVIRIATPLMEQDKLTAAEIAENVDKIRDTYKPVNQLTGTFVIMLIAGVVFSAIFAALLRTKDTFTLTTKDKE